MSKHSSSGQHYFEYGDFNFIPLLQQWALEEAEKFMKGSEAQPTNFTRLYWRDGFNHLVDKIDKELASKNLPDVLLIHLFKRPPLFASAIHYDTYNVKNFGPKKFTGIFHRQAALNIPVEGCDDGSFFNFFKMHTQQRAEQIETVDHEGRRQIKTHIVWDDDKENPPTLLEQACMRNPMFVRSGIPHQGVTGPVSKIHLSMRFIVDEPLEFFKRRLIR
jgi:hypothetical protein